MGEAPAGDNRQVPKERRRMNITAIISMLQAAFCGGLFFSIALIYQRRESTYKLLPSLCAFGLASLFGMQWLTIVADMLRTGAWPNVSLFTTLIFGILFALIIRSKGNVSRIFDLSGKPGKNRRRDDAGRKA